MLHLTAMALWEHGVPIDLYYNVCCIYVTKTGLSAGMVLKLGHVKHSMLFRILMIKKKCTQGMCLHFTLMHTLQTL